MRGSSATALRGQVLGGHHGCGLRRDDQVGTGRRGEVEAAVSATNLTLSYTPRGHGQEADRHLVGPWARSRRTASTKEEYSTLVRCVIALVCLGLAPVTLGGCGPEDFGGTFYVVNDSAQPVFYATTRIESGGDSLSISLQRCGEPGLQLYDEARAVVVRVDEEWCPGDTLTVRGPGDYTLGDTPTAPQRSERQAG